jgi:hypothetical protein
LEASPRQIVREKPFTKRAGGVAQGEGPQFQPQYHKRKKKERDRETGNGEKMSWDPSSAIKSNGLTWLIEMSEFSLVQCVSKSSHPAQPQEWTGEADPLTGGSTDKD